MDLKIDKDNGDDTGCHNHIVSASNTSAGKQGGPAVFDIPELAESVAQYLRLQDLAHLCLANKDFQAFFRPLYWRIFTFRSNSTLWTGSDNDSRRSPYRPTDMTVVTALSKNIHLLRSVELCICRNDLLRVLSPDLKIYHPDDDDDDLCKILKSVSTVRCTTLTRFTYKKFNDKFLAKGYRKTPDLLLSILYQNPCLVHLDLNTEVVLFYLSKFEAALLSLTSLRSLKISMAPEEATARRSTKLLLTLMNQHPSLEAILFGDWYSGHPGVRNQFYPDGEFEDVTDFAELEASESTALLMLEQQLRTPGTGGYPQLKRLEFPNGCHATWGGSFLSALFRSGLPNLVSLQVFSVRPTDELMELCRVGCPKLEQLVLRIGGRLAHDWIHRFPRMLRSIISPGISSLSSSYPLFQRHAETLSSLILTHVMQISSKVLHRLLMVCKSLKVFQLTVSLSQNTRRIDSRDYSDKDFQSGSWGCTGLEILTILDCGIYRNSDRRWDDPPDDSSSPEESRRYFWRQVGRLQRLRELEIGGREYPHVDEDRYLPLLIHELKLSWPEQLPEESSHEDQEEESGEDTDSDDDPNQGLLQLLRDLKLLQALRLTVATDFRWALPRQAEVEFMERNWPRFEEFSYEDQSQSREVTLLLAEEPHWRWFKSKRPSLQIIEKRKLDEPDDGFYQEEDDDYEYDFDESSAQ
ncbi:hypothetical protein BGZ83_001828 [Gryganskiella cystojenkinii]|nr:hypothetical protein BGZ83_001828 [Gryganskiella cystojenkinii]